VAVVLGVAVCAFAVIGVVSVVDGDPAAPAKEHAAGTTDRSGLITEPPSAPLELAVSKRAITNCNAVDFTGRIPPQRVPVVLEARSPDLTWTAFRIVHTDGDGRFAARYDFTRTIMKTRYGFRAVIFSAPTSVLVTPRRAGSSPPRPACAAPQPRRR
jgi:hypothetical protein